MIHKKLLQRLYCEQQKSMKEVSVVLGCSVHRVEYWLKKHNLPRRSRSDAMYHWHNPNGDPFSFIPPQTPDEHVLFGMGLGLYWGEGTKANPHAVRLGNTDPALIGIFFKFLMRFFSIRSEDCRFGLQLFADMDADTALDFWTKRLKIHKRQFYKVTITPSNSLGTYRRKSRYGVLTFYYNNRKLRDRLIHCLHDYGYVIS